MLSPGKGGSAPVYGHALGHATYERHRPEQTLLYRLIEKHYPALVEQLVPGQIGRRLQCPGWCQTTKRQNSLRYDPAAQSMDGAVVHPCAIGHGRIDIVARSGHAYGYLCRHDMRSRVWRSRPSYGTFR